MSANLLTILPSLTVSSEEVRQAEEFAQQYLTSLYPTVDFRPGLAIYDQVIRPNATLIALVNKGLQFYFTNNTKEGVTNDTPEDFVDKLMSNHFLTRRTGSTAVVSARLFFLQRKNVFISSSYYFSTNNEQFFYPRENTSISAADMLVSTSTDSLAPYYIDIELEAESPGKDYDIETGSLLFYSTFDPFFVGGNILFLKENTITKETNLEFVDRTEASVSTRNLINDPSIVERMTSTFNFVDHVQPIGHSDDEMIRDIRFVNTPLSTLPSSIHLGGMVDVYVNSPMIQVSQSPVKIESKDGQLGFYLDGALISYTPAVTPTEAPIEITPGEDGYLVSTPVGTTPSWNRLNSPMNFVGYGSDGKVENEDYSLDTGFSTEQRAFVPMPATVALLPSGSVAVEEGLFFYVNVIKFLGLESIQTYLDDVATRVVAADYVARAMDVFLLDFYVTTFGDEPAPDAATIQPFIDKYISDLEPGSTFVMADFICVLNDDAALNNLVTPVAISYTRYTRNGKVVSGTIEDRKDIDRLSRFEVGTITTGTVPLDVVNTSTPITT